MSPDAMQTKPLIRACTDADIEQIAIIHAQSSPRRYGSMEWISCNFRAYPRMQYYVAELDGDVCGYSLWTEKSGYRVDAVFELEQLAVTAPHQRQGVGSALIQQSLKLVADCLAARGSTLCAVKVTTRIDNLVAQRLYSRTLGAAIVATIPSLFSVDEVVMLSRNPFMPAGQTTTGRASSVASGQQKQSI